MERFLITTHNSAEKAAVTKKTTAPLEITPNEETTKELNESDHTMDVDDGIKFHHKKIRKQQFRPAWLVKFLWLKKVRTQNGNEKPFCDFCCKFLTCNIANLRRHEESEAHKKSVLALKKQPEISDVNTVAEFTKKKNQVKSAELKTTMFFIEHNLPFSLITPFTTFVKSIAPDSTILKDLKFGKTKMTETTNNTIFEEGQKMISDIIRKQNFSIIIDETTDVSTTKCLVIVVRYFDFSFGKVLDRFFSLLSIKNCDSKSIFESIMNVFEKLNIPLENLIGFASDNASTRIGRKSGVSTLLKSKQPYLFRIGCTCHSIHLCSAAASKKIPEHIEALARNIYVFFSHSSKRQDDFKDFQEYFNVKPHKILKTSSTRWLSLENVVSRILEQWTPLQHYFITYQLENNADLAHDIYKQMTDESKIYLCFLSYILKLTNKINMEYQSEETRIHILLPTVRMYFKSIVSNFIKRNCITDENLNEVDLTNKNDSFLNIEEIYIGAQANLVIQKGSLTLSQLKKIKSACLAYYIELCEQILIRIDFNDQVLNAVEILNPKKQFPTLTPIINLFPNLVAENCEEELDAEWRLLLCQDYVNKDLCINQFWSSVFNLKNGINELMFPNLKKLISSLLSLPHSSACAERIFSQVNLIKNKQRNCLLTSTVQSILMGKELLKNSDSAAWTPNKDMVEKYTKKCFTK